jgi:hypothetical protein
MTPSKPTIRNCPFCRIAMVGSRSKPGQADFDTFHCLHCDTMIHLDGAPEDREPSGNDGLMRVSSEKP